MAITGNRILTAIAVEVSRPMSHSSALFSTTFPIFSPPAPYWAGSPLTILLRTSHALPPFVLRHSLSALATLPMGLGGGGDSRGGGASSSSSSSSSSAGTGSENEEGLPSPSFYVEEAEIPAFAAMGEMIHCCSSDNISRIHLCLPSLAYYHTRLLTYLASVAASGGFLSGDTPTPSTTPMKKGDTTLGAAARGSGGGSEGRNASGGGGLGAAGETAPLSLPPLFMFSPHAAYLAERAVTNTLRLAAALFHQGSKSTPPLAPHLSSSSSSSLPTQPAPPAVNTHTTLDLVNQFLASLLSFPPYVLPCVAPRLAAGLALLLTQGPLLPAHTVGIFRDDVEGEESSTWLQPTYTPTTHSISHSIPSLKTFYVSILRLLSLLRPFAFAAPGVWGALVFFFAALLWS